MSDPRIVTGDDVQNAVQATLAEWLPPVLDLYELKAPSTHEAPTVDAARLDAAAFPVLLVDVAGLVDAPQRDQDGVYTGRFDCLIDFLLRGDQGTYEETARQAMQYAAAIRTVLIERPTLDGFAQDVTVGEETYTGADPSAARTLAQGEVACVVTVFDINRIGTTFTEPGNPAPIASTTEVTVQPV